MATKDATMTIRVESDLKREVEKIFKQLGLSNSEAIYLFFKMVKFNHGLPFEVKIPNQETIETLERTDRGEELTRYKSKEELFEDLRNL